MAWFTEQLWVIILTAAVAVGVRATSIRHEDVIQSLAERVAERFRGDRSSGGDRSGGRSGGGWTGLTGGNIHLPPTPGQSLVKLEWRHAGHHPAPALPALAEVSVTVVLLEVPVLLTDIVPPAGVPLGGGGGGGGRHTALRHLPGL